MPDLKQVLSFIVWLLIGCGKPPSLRSKDKESRNETGASNAELHDNTGDATSAQVRPQHPRQSEGFPDHSHDEETRRRRIYRLKLLTGLLLPWWLVSVDTTIVATALPQIASHFGKLSELNWIATAYSLTATSFIPIFGQLADVFGRHTALQVSVFFILIGSTLAAAAQVWAMLLLGRALQGVGAAGAQVLVQIIIADKVNLADNAKNDTAMTLVASIAYATSPVIGGYLTSSNWRYCFIISIPISLAAHFAIFFALRKELVRGTYHLSEAGSRTSSMLAVFDFGGVLFFILGVGLIILGATWGGTKHPWTDSRVVVPIVIGGLLFCSFFIYERMLEPGRYLAKRLGRTRPMVPWSLFQKKDTSLLAIICCSSGASLYACFYFISIFWNIAMAYPPSRAGVQLLYYLPGLGVGTILAMFLCNIYPRQTFYPLLIGAVIEVAGMSVLPWALAGRNRNIVNGMMALSGCGTGLRFMPTGLHTAGIWPLRLAAAVSLTAFANEFGGTLAIAIMGAVFNSKWTQYLSDLHSENGDLGEIMRFGDRRSLDAINSLPQNLQEAVRHQAARAVMWSFISVLPIVGAGFVASACLGNVWVNRTGDNSRAAELSKGSVIEESLVLTALRGNVREKMIPRLLSGEEGSQMTQEDRPDHGIVG